jgi:hypothetical protein
MWLHIYLLLHDHAAHQKYILVRLQIEANPSKNQTSLAGTFLRRFFTAAGGVCHSLVLGCGAVGLFSINYFRKKKINIPQNSISGELDFLLRQF